MRSPSRTESPRLWMRGTVVVLAVGLMVVVPALALSGKRPSPWGWQMYAGHVDMPLVQVTKQNGDTEIRNFNEIVAWPRPEPEYLEPMARFVCAKDPSVRSVMLTSINPTVDKVFKCSSF